MENQPTGTNEAQANQVESDPWAAAFAALEPKGEDGAEGPADAGAGEVVPEGTVEHPEGADQDGGLSNDATPADSSADEDAAGGLGDTPGSDTGQGDNAFAGHLGITEESIQRFEQELDDNIRDQAIKEVAEEFVKRGIRNRDGVLGATLDDPDICKRDSDGVPHFYNPETGQEFRGDNPRRQAQEWVDDYNKELARVFNNTCQDYESHLKEEAAPQLAVMKFAPKYEKLDEIRRGMFEDVIEDYEVKDADGKVIGYSCDLDKALALVDRQIERIQSYGRQRQQQQQEQQEAQPTSPALDMKSSSGAVQAGEDAPITSLADAMERLQNQQLDKLKRN